MAILAESVEGAGRSRVQRVRCRQDRARGAAPVINALVSAAFAVRVCDLRASTRRGADVALARQIAMYLAHTAIGMSYAEVGRAFVRDRTTVAHACRLIEERRERPLLQAMLSELECALSRIGVASEAAL